MTKFVILTKNDTSWNGLLKDHSDVLDMTKAEAISALRGRFPDMDSDGASRLLGEIEKAQVHVKPYQRQGRLVVGYSQQRPEGLVREQISKYVVVEDKKPNEMTREEFDRFDYSSLRNPEFLDAVSNTEGAKITPDGLELTVVRYQKKEQAGAQSVRTGVFYLPEKNSPYKHYYSTGKIGYGGHERLEGKTKYKHPVVVNASTGGKGPERAYDAINGKGAYETMRNDVLSHVVGYMRNPTAAEVAEILKKYGGDTNLAGTILRVSKEGNMLPYAIQEHIVAASMRNKGYDSIICYNKLRGGWRLTEVFDVRTNTYPYEDWQDNYSEFYDEQYEKMNLKKSQVRG